jgi:type II secretory pathway pseudopilin PulG
VFCDHMVSLTALFSPSMPVDDRIETECLISTQQLFGVDPGAVRRRRRVAERHLQEVINDVGYTMTYTSQYENVTGYPVLFRTYVNSNLENLTLALQDLGLQVVSSQPALPALLTDPPTISPTTSMPSQSPTTAAPSGVPSVVATTASPITDPPVTELPTAPPAPPPEPSQGSQIGTGAIVGVAIVAIAALLVALVLFYRYRKRLLEKAFQERAVSARRAEDSGALDQPDPSMPNEYGERPISQMAQNPVISPSSSSLESRKSFLSEGDSQLDAGQSGDEEDGTENLKDEFDVYRNEELEIMRSKVEGNVAGGDGMMSQALTSVLMEDDDPEGVDQWVVTWGGTGDSMEIEASALCEVNDWVKRKEAALEDDRYVDVWIIVRDLSPRVSAAAHNLSNINI